MTLRGNIDTIRDGAVMGWAYDDDQPDTMLNVAAVAGDSAISAARAAIFRNDLLLNGIGNGRHGFRLEIPEAVLKREIIHILETRTLRELPTSPIDKRIKNLGILDGNDPILLLDVTGILAHLERFDILSGISRAEMEIVRAFSAPSFYNYNNLKFIALNQATAEFEDIDKSGFIKFIEEFQESIKFGKYVRQNSGWLDVRQFLCLESLDLESAEYERAVLIELGASWTLPLYTECVKRMKLRGTRFIPLVQDILALKSPDLHISGVYHDFQIYMRKMLSHADAILAGSRNTGKDIQDFASDCGRECPPLYVSRNGVTHFAQAAILPPAVSRPFALIVSTLEVRKNHLLVVNAWEKLYQKHGDALPDLIFVGQWGWKVRDLIQKLEICRYLDSHIKILNNITDDDLAKLYQECLFTIYPSRYEGWGLPVAEGLSFGKACLCSNASSLPEVGLDFCVYFDPDDLEDVTGKAEKLIFNNGYRTSLEDRIRREYKPVEWADVAMAIAKAARETAAKPARDTVPTVSDNEYSFCRPAVFSTPAPHAFVEAVNFRMPQMSKSPRSWDSYARAEELIYAGRYTHADGNGILGSLQGNEFRFRLPECMAQGAMLYLVVSSEEENGRLEILSGRNVRMTAQVSNSENLICLDSENFQRGREVRFTVRPVAGGRIRYRTFMAVARNNLDSRLNALEQLSMGQRKTC